MKPGSLVVVLPLPLDIKTFAAHHGMKLPTDDEKTIYTIDELRNLGKGFCAGLTECPLRDKRGAVYLLHISLLREIMNPDELNIEILLEESKEENLYVLV